MTHQGQVQTFASALPTLLRLSRTPGKFRAILGCHGAPTRHPVPDSARDLADLDWSHCPLDLLDSPHFRVVATLDRLAKVAPLSGWPDRYAAWAVGGLLTLRRHNGEG